MVISAQRLVFTLRGSGRRCTDGSLFQDYDVFHACSGSSVTSVINKFFFYHKMLLKHVSLRFIGTKRRGVNISILGSLGRYAILVYIVYQALSI